MPRVIGVDIPGNKKVFIALAYIYGVGRKRAEEIVEKLGLDGDKRAQNLTNEEIARLNALLQAEYMVEGDLRRKVQNDIKRLIAINSYRGMRHRVGLPVRGQRTRTNSRTRKGKRKTVAGKKKVAAKG